MLSNKKLWIAGGVALLLFALFFVFTGDQEPPAPEFFVNQTDPEAEMPVSAIYGYDSIKQEFFVEENSSWQNADFTRYIFDVAPKDTELESCSYFIYDADQGRTTGGGARKCNSGIVIRVGDGKACSSQGEDKCFLYASAQDVAGTVGEYAISSYYIDYTSPEVGRPYVFDEVAQEITTQFGEELEYRARVADNLELAACHLYIDGATVGSMTVDSCSKDGSCLASTSYAIEEGEQHTAFVVCGDHYVVQDGKYLNIKAGPALSVIVLVNKEPKIASCRVTPTSGTTLTSFAFSVEASDPNEDELSYIWDFGDSTTSNQSNPSHQYNASGTFTPKVQVLDAEGLSDECSTAWVVVGE